MRKRIALFMPCLSEGGVERVMLNLAEGLVHRNLQVDLVVTTATGGFRNQIPLGVQLVDLCSDSLSSSLPRLVKYLRKHEPHVIISAKDDANVILLVAKLLAFVKTRTVITVHSFILSTCWIKPSFRNRITPFLCRLLYPFADKIIAVSHAVAKDTSRVLKIPLKRIETIYNPVISDKLIKLSQEAVDVIIENDMPIILAVGRLAREKDFITLLKAFKRLSQTREARLIIIGEGDERLQLESTVRELDIGGRVSLKGFKGNPYAYISKSSVVVVSSLWEGFSNVLIEALALGVNVVSTDCGGPREILQNGLLGELVPIGDEVALNNAICRALKRPAGTKNELLRDFTVDAAVEKYCSLVRTIM